MTHIAVDKNVSEEICNIIQDAMKSFRKKSKRPDTDARVKYVKRNPTNIKGIELRDVFLRLLIME